MRLSLTFGLALLLVLPARAMARQTCDLTDENQYRLETSRVEIEFACPCAAAAERSSYRRCANAAVDTLVDVGFLPEACQREARLFAHRSICGREAAVVCCRVNADGRTRHGTARSAKACRDTDAFTSCVSEWSSVVTGCEASGCVSPSAAQCGNWLIEPGEDCDPPEDNTCDAFCQAIPCETVSVDCGNLILDVGEACEPPGVGDCGRDCQVAPCSAPHAGETAVACVEGTSSLGAAGTSSGYLLAWSGGHRRNGEILARRFHANGTPVDDSVTVVTEETACGTTNTRPSVASDGVEYYVAWSAYGNPPGFHEGRFQSINGRRLGAASGAEATDTLASVHPIGSCAAWLSGPTSTAAAATSRYGVSWQTGAACLPGIRFPGAVLLDFTPTFTSTGVSLQPFDVAAVSSTGIASLSGGTLWVRHAVTLDALHVPYLAATWSDGLSTGTSFNLSARTSFIDNGHPTAAAGTTGLLVVWSQGADDAATVLTEIRGVRVTRADGRIDPDGGLLLASVPEGVNGSPVVAFDGTRWLVAWSQASTSGHELRAVAVNADGTVVDSSPRLVADDVAPAEDTSTYTGPALASTGDGRVLALFARDDGTRSSVRTTLVVP